MSMHADDLVVESLPQLTVLSRKSLRVTVSELAKIQQLPLQRRQFLRMSVRRSSPVRLCACDRKKELAVIGIQAGVQIDNHLLACGEQVCERDGLRCHSCESSFVFLADIAQHWGQKLVNRPVVAGEIDDEGPTHLRRKCRRLRVAA
jgi:hypothetical protein